MGNTVLGVVAPLPQGAWNSTTTYQKLSVVREGNSSYIAKSANVNIHPGVTDSWETYWMLLNEDGDTGQQGPQGATGVGVPDGGLKGYILVKRSQDNYDDEWVDPDNITVGNATKAVQDENGNNIADTYQTKQDSTDQNTALQTQITSNTQGITKNSQLISRNSARLTNVEQRISPSPFVKDSTVAYVKDVPANALPYAELQKLGGMTYRVNLGTDDAPNYVLRSAPVTSVESVGANLITAQEAYKGLSSYNEMVIDGRNCIRMTSGSSIENSPIKFKENTQYTVSFYTKSENYNGATIGNNVFTFWYADGTESSVTYPPNVSEWGKVTLTSVAGKTVVAVGIMAREYRAYNYIDIDTFMLNEGSTALPYAPYTKSTLPIPEDVQALDGYGDGVNESVYNYITWNPEGNVKSYTKTVGAVDMGTLDWKYGEYFNGSGNQSFYAIGNLNNAINDNNTAPIALCALYEPLTPTQISQGVEGFTFHGSSKYLVINDSNYTDAATFKAAMAGVMLYYKLATPKVTDISALITADNLLPVQGNGTITFVNEYGYAVPSTVEYMT